MRDYGRAALTGKVRYNKTELKIGELRPTLPVAYIDDSRQLITTYHGVQLESKEVDNLTLTGAVLPKSVPGSLPIPRRCTCSMDPTLNVAVTV